MERFIQKTETTTPRSILIFRALQLGDLMCTIPAWRALRNSFPNAEITLVGLPWSRSFVTRFRHLLDGFIEFPGFPGLPEQTPDIRRFPEFVSELQRRKFDLALQMHGAGDLSNPIVQLFGTRRTAGFFLPGQYCPDPQNYLVYPNSLREVRRHLALMTHLGIPSQGEHLEFPLSPQDEQDFAALGLSDLRPGQYICVHPGARAWKRRWPPQHFAVVADRLAAEGLQVVLTGSEVETDLTRAVSRAMTAPSLDLAGRTSLGALAVLLTQARLLVCNDTGVSHLADALRTPSVVLFSASNPGRWAPLDFRLHRTIPNALEAAPERVAGEAEKLLAEERVYA